MMLLGIIAVVLSLVLTLHSMAGMGLVGCGGGSSCELVTGSRWSLLFGIIPVSAVALGLYLAILACCLYLWREEDRDVLLILLLLCVAAICGSLWFILLQAVKIKAFCPYCMSAHVCGILLSLLGIRHVLGTRMVPRKKQLLAFCAGVLAVGLFVAVQVATTPSYRVQTGAVPGALQIPDTPDVPRVGTADAPRTLALLYDYRCPHCQVIHNMLDEVVAHFSGDVSIVLCPTPLSPACNPYVPSGTDRFPGSCALAKMALALWHRDPALFRQFDAWLFSGDDGHAWSPRNEDAAVARLQALGGVGSEDEAWADSYLQSTLELFARTSLAGQGGIPRLVADSTWIIPEVDDQASLIALIEGLL